MKFILRILRLLPHAAIILALCFLTFTILDWYNPLMAFTTNALSTKLLIIFCIVTILSSVGNLVMSKRLADVSAVQTRTETAHHK